jgi:multiple sugar transport system permease protein
MARGRALTVLVAPTIGLLLFLVIYPTVYLWGMMFFSFHPARDPYPKFVGLENFVILVTDNVCWESLLRTLVLMGVSLPLELALGVAIAILLASKYTVGRLPLRILILIPMMIPSVITGLNWKTILYYYGPINSFLSSLWIEPQPWLSTPFGNPSNVIFCLSLLDIWQWTPFVVLAMMSAIESLPKDLYEAASLDGASEFQILRRVTLPMTKSVFVVVVLLRVIDLLKTFDTVYTLTYGGPGNSTTTYPFYIFKTGFSLMSLHPSYGYTALLSIVLLAVATLLTTVIMRILKIERLIWG